MKPKQNLNIFYWLNNLLYMPALKKSKKPCANTKPTLQYKEKKASNF